MPKIIVLATGGTFEKVYDEAQGKVENRESILEAAIVRKLRLPHASVEVVTIRRFMVAVQVGKACPFQSLYAQTDGLAAPFR